MQPVGVSADTVAAQKDFETKAQLSIPLLADAGRNLINLYGVGNSLFGGLANRWTFVIDKAGVVRIIDKAVKAASHGKNLAEKINF